MRSHIFMSYVFPCPSSAFTTNFWLYLRCSGQLKQVLLMPKAVDSPWSSPAAVGGKQLQYGCSAPTSECQPST